VNHTLFAISNVLATMQTPNVHIPYRESKLTLFLRESLEESALVTVFASVDLDEASTVEPTLKFVKHVCRTKRLGVTHGNKNPAWGTFRRKIIAGNVLKNVFMQNK
jgi:hypothetical protein